MDIFIEGFKKEKPGNPCTQSGDLLLCCVACLSVTLL